MNIKKLIILPFLLLLTIGLNAQKPGKYNKFIKKGQYAEGLAYVKEKGGLSEDSYNFNGEIPIIISHAFNPNFSNEDYKTILFLVNKAYKNINFPDRSYNYLADAYLTKVFHYLWKGDFEKANTAYTEAKEEFAKYKTEANIHPKDTKVIETIIDNKFYDQLESHKLVKVFQDFNLDNLNLSEEDAYDSRNVINNLLNYYNNAPRKVLYIPFQDYLNHYENDEGNLDCILTVSKWGDYDYIQENFFYNLSDKQINDYFPNIDIYEIFGSDYKTKAQKEKDSRERKEFLVKTYGKKFGESIFNGKVLIGMPKELIKNELREPREIDLTQYHEFWIWSDIMLTIDKETNKVTGILNF